MITLLIAALLSGQDYNDPANRCANPMSGLDVSACIEMLLNAETARMDRYLAAASATLEGRKSESGEDFAATLAESQTQWEAYADAACGLARDASRYLEQDCRSGLTQERTLYLWTYFLVQDDGPALLDQPEPLTVETAPEPAGEPGD
ncbi:lysozyme inhibitor LprI family protein [Brevundimonas sp.]|uniref:lysozyme inhibitor LprI family protein n=1 Tax=Brevundimonas sp. TaxID=1871086 RepID=UPI002FCBDA2B